MRCVKTLNISHFSQGTWFIGSLVVRQALLVREGLPATSAAILGLLMTPIKMLPAQILELNVRRVISLYLLYSMDVIPARPWTCPPVSILRRMILKVRASVLRFFVSPNGHTAAPLIFPVSTLALVVCLAIVPFRCFSLLIPTVNSVRCHSMEI